MKKSTVVILSFLLASLLFAVHLPAKERAIKVNLRESERVNAPVVAEVDLYSDSYALVIGINNYTKGWPRLSGAVHDAELVAEALREKGFQVTFRKDLNSRELKQAFEEFYIFKGEDPQTRLFVWFAGHGHTLDGEGFLIPADAPGPDKGAQFKYKALSMRRFGEFVRLAKAKHALAVFDSCFSGTIFDTQRTAPPPAVTRATTLPVRQFLSSGDSNQKVSDDGRFRKLFIRAIRGEERADANRDGYLTGSELGLFLTDRLTNLTQARQTPRYGKLRDEDWDRGDFVFRLAGSGWGHYGPGPSGSTLRVKANVNRAVVFVDSRKAGQTPLEGYAVKPGSHRIVVEKAGYETYRDTVQIEKGRVLSLRVMLKAATPRKARLYVDTEPSNATVRILNIGPRFYQGIEMDPGRYHVEVSAEGYETEKEWVDLAAGEDERLSVRLESAGPEREFTNSLGMKFVKIPSGSFIMGSPSNEGERDSDEVQHRVTISKPFYMQTMEVTVGQWRKFVRDLGYKTEAETGGGAYVWTGKKWEKKEGTYWDNPGFDQSDNNPVTCVSWNDAQAFIKWLNRKEGKDYRLPTEAQWEYAARAGTRTVRFWGDDPDEACQYANVRDRALKGRFSGAKEIHNCDDGSVFTAPVGSFSPNSFGLHDILGNVWEWCQDWYGDYSPGSVTNPTGPVGGSYRVGRGGSWYNRPRGVQCADRRRGTPGLRDSSLDFRLTRTP